jgi:hypothetical protein
MSASPTINVLVEFLVLFCTFFDGVAFICFALPGGKEALHFGGKSLDGYLGVRGDTKSPPF